jgi:hypothetical protein
MDNEEVIQKVLAHHGVLGMKWGVHRSGGSESSGSSSKKKSKSEVSVKTKSNPQIKTIVTTKGGRGLPAHPDAVSARIVEQKLKKSGTHALSNDELQKYNMRKNLEQQAKRLGPESHFEKGSKFVTSYLKSPEGQKATMEAVSKISKKKVVSKAAKLGVAAAL